MKRKAHATPLRKAAKTPAGRRTAKNQKTRKKLDVRLRKQAVSPDKPGQSPQSETTACKRAEEAIRQNEQRMRAILDGALDAVVEMDVQGMITRWNPRAETIFGWTRSEAVGRRLSATIIPPQHREAHARGLQHFMATGEGPILNRRIEITASRRDGTEFPVELTVTAIPLGNSHRFTAFINDITARKLAEETLRESESRFRLVMDHANDAIIYLDPYGRIQWASCQSTVLTGRPMTELVGNLVMSTFTPAAAVAAEARLVAVRRGEAVPPRVEFEILRPDGSLVWAEANITSVQRAEGVIGRLLVLRDITERKLAEREHRDLYERLQGSHRALRALSRQMMKIQEEERHHLARELHDEIGQALTVAKINIQQAMHALGGPTAATHLVESVSLLDRTLQQVRNLALDLRPSLLDDLGLIPTLTWLAERHSQASEVAVQVSAESLDIRPTPEIELACYRIAQEALTNAARHARASRINIELARSGRELVLLIQDNGIGFDMTTMLSRAAEGESIGLMGMQERVTLTGGEMEILSSPGEGTKIRARFPLDAPGPFRDTRA